MFEQTDRPMKLTTPLGPNALLLAGFSGREAISQLFHFELKTAWEDKNKLLPFDQLLGKKVTVEIASLKNKRYFNGIVCKVTQYERDEYFTYYTLEVVPELWLLDRKLRSRTFQHINVPDILKKLLTGLDVAYQIDGTFEQREYCVQYRETDLAFASRLMEEEGIYYFFKHSSSGHQLVLANTPQSHPAVPYLPTVIWEESAHASMEEDRVFDWCKGQEIRSGKFTAWDHKFEMPTKHLEAEKTIMDSVTVGTVTHKLKVANNDNLEIYDYPGGYASRFDGINKSGGEQVSNLQHVFSDNKRTVDIRMQEEALSSLLIRGKGAQAGFTAGHTFDLTNHYSDNGKFVLTSVEHDAKQPLNVDDRETAYNYANWFTCIPSPLPYRPPRVTPVPIPRGIETAVVVGPAGEEIFPDKYGRVKVQFHWDREGADDVNSSCWVRVATYWAGNQWGAVHIPRIGQEVIVDYVEGDVNHPIIVGSVYNADMMPPYPLPGKKTVSTVKSRSTKGGAKDNYNEFRFEDLKGKEQVFLQAERDKDVRVKAESRTWIGGNRHRIVKKSQKERVDQDKHSSVGGNYVFETGGNKHIKTNGSVYEKISGNHESTLDGNSIEKTSGSNDVTVSGDHIGKVAGKMSLTVGGSLEQKSGTKFAHEAGQEIHLKAGMKVVIEAGMQLTLKGPGGFVDIGPAGVTIQGTMVLINSGGAAGSGSGSSPGSPAIPKAPQAPEEPDAADDGTNFDKM